MYQGEAEDLANEREEEEYMAAFDDEVNRQYADYVENFGEEFQRKHPFKQDSIAAHAVAMVKITKEEL